MIGVAGFALIVGLGGAVVPVAEYDIPWYQANPQILEETLRRCHNDQRLAYTVECENAEAAGTRSLGKPMPPLNAPVKRPAPAKPPAIPVTKGRIRAS